MLIQLDYLDLEKSVNLLLNSIKLDLGVKTIQVVDAVGEVLAEDIIAKDNIPPYNISFYDGYAVRSEDIKIASKKKPIRLRVIGTIYPDDNPNKFSLNHNEAVYIPSGAPLVNESDTVIRFERVKVEGNYILVSESSEPLDRVILQGEDVKKDEIVYKKGHMIRPQDNGLLLQLGYGRVRVFLKPKIGIISVGDEIRKKFENNRLSYPDNFYILIKSFFEAFNFSVDHIGVAPDNIQDIKEVVKKSCQNYDVLLTISGASTGEKDLVHLAFQEVGKIVFHGVRLSPGKVTGLALIGGKPVFMVPGHVGSLYVCLSLYIAPLLFKSLCGVEEPFLKLRVKLDYDIHGKPHMSAMRTIKLIQKKGEYIPKVVEKRLGGSGLLTLLTQANGFVVIPPGVTLKRGDYINVYLLNHYEVFHINK